MFGDINLDLFYFFNHSLQNPFFDFIMPAITDLGGFVVLCLILVIIIIYSVFFKKETLKKIAVLTLFTLLFSGLIAVLVKHLIHEPRPFAVLDNVRLLIMENDPLSFPSGHSASTFAVVSFLILNMKKLSRHYKIIDLCLIIFAVIIPFSRMYVGVHYPLDVLAGCLLGIISALIVNRYKCGILNIIIRIKSIIKLK